MGIKLFTNLSCDTAVTHDLLAVHVVQIKIDSCRTDMVYIVIGLLVGVDLPLLGSHCVCP